MKYFSVNASCLSLVDYEKMSENGGAIIGFLIWLICLSAVKIIVAYPSEFVLLTLNKRRQ